ncbi:MAG: outer membrane protein assembly factor BamA [Acidobacteriia bacterium]|nr:outer membrane protein assembly factor BamA [Terriglobia bacterium]
MSKWHFSDNSRIIWLFPPWSEGSHIASSFCEETSPKLAARIGPLALILGLFLCGLVPKSFAVPQAGQIIEDIDVSGNRRIPTETVKSRIYTRVGDVYDETALQRDLRSVWNSGYFEDVRMEREQSPKGWRIHIYVREKPTIRTIDYKGLNSVSVSDVLERYKKVKVPLTVDSPYDPTKVIKAKVVLQQLLSEHGRQFATISVQVQQVPPASVAVVFNVKEGPKIKVGKIRFTGNKHVKSRTLRAAMKNLHPIGIPRSIFLEGVFAKTFDASKLEEDAERVREALQTYGYFKAVVDDPKTQLRDTSSKFHIPFLQKGQGKVMDITVPIEEGDKYKLKAITFKGNKAILNTTLLRNIFPIKDGETFNKQLIGKGLDNLRKAYGELGYIDFTPVPTTDIDDEKKEITLNVEVEEGKPYFVRRIEFQGNTTTRDRVIRRELLVQEGQVFNSRLWDISVLRLNQLNYFDALKPEDDTERKLNTQDGTVDLTVKVREKGKNSIGLTGGVSGLEGSFIGLNYETNNFLGLGETLQVQANVGSLSRVLLFGFTEPYMFDRPLTLGFTVYSRRFDFNQARQASINAGQNLNLPQSVLNQLLNYNQSSTGFTASSSYLLGHSFKRVGLTYSLDTTTINTFSDASRNLFQTLNFRNISGPDALKGIITSSITPSLSFSTIDSPVRPHRGKSLYLSSEIAGLGGNVKFYRPLVAFTQWKPLYHQNTLGVRLQASFINGFGGSEAPPYQRFYMGGENDLRGFDVRTVSPYVFVSTVQNFQLTNPDGSAVPVDPSNPRRGNVAIPLPVNNITLPGGDTQFVSNVEYRIHVIGPVTLAPFVDFGMDFVTLDSQLKISGDSLTQLNSTIFGCPAIVGFQCSGGAPLTFSGNLKPVEGTNFVPRMSTGLELQVLLPIVQQPFRIYYALNPLTLNTLVHSPSPITRSMFPLGAAGDFTFQSAIATLGPDFRLQEPRKTFRFTISTTF